MIILPWLGKLDSNFQKPGDVNLIDPRIQKTEMTSLTVSKIPKIEDTTIFDPKIQQSEEKTIISYANKNFYTALRNLVGSVHFWEPQLQIVVFNLGMLDEQLEDIRKWRNTKLVTFDFILYPDHFRDLHKYAFKPIILNRTFHEYGFIFLEDAGQEFRQPITKLKEWIKRDGLFLTDNDRDTLPRDLRLTHPGPEKYLNITLQRGHCQPS